MHEKLNCGMHIHISMCFSSLYFMRPFKKKNVVELFYFFGLFVLDECTCIMGDKEEKNVIKI